MSSETVVAAKYAKAVLALAQERQEAETVAHELQWIAEQLGGPEGQAFLTNPLLPPEKKMELFQGEVGERLSGLTLSLLRLLVEKRRGGLIPYIAASYAQAWLALRERAVATVTTAMPLTEAQLQKLGKRLRTWYGSEVELQQKVDADLKAGARVEIGDLLLDGTLQARLGRLRRAMTAEN